ncbi:MAG: TrbI/VirB10 family protein [Burkholderiaceae bacterium]|nr:TrbI/VirB10 family protein [Burkholderiaceae bacterium]
MNMAAIQANPANSPKESADNMALRATPPQVMRLNRRTLSILVGVLSAAVLGATVWSLQGVKRQRDGASPELHNVDRVSKSEGLDKLPADYAKIPPAAVPPVLGPPLPGDLGRPILRAEREAGLPQTPIVGARSNTFDDAAHAERLNRIREVEEAAKAPVVFKQSGHPAARTNGDASPSNAALGQTDRRGNIDAATNAPDGGQPAGSTATSPQDRKQAFIDRAADPATLSTNRLQLPASPYQVMAGTIIPAALLTGINSDLPGQVIATVTESVYDTATSRHLLIPQGSRLMGRYDSQVAFGQRRVLLVWTRLIMPDTSSIALDRLPGVDPAGYAGLEDGLDWHWDRILAGGLLSTLLGVGAELAAPQRSGAEGQVIIAAKQSVQDTVNEVGKEITKRNLDIQPTLTIRPGFLLRIVVSKDMVLRPYQPLFYERSGR